MSNWENKFKDRLADAGLGLPEGDWEVLRERRAVLSRQKKRKTALLWAIPAAAAAAAALVLLLRDPSLPADPSPGLPSPGSLADLPVTITPDKVSDVSGDSPAASETATVPSGIHSAPSNLSPAGTDPILGIETKHPDKAEKADPTAAPQDAKPTLPGNDSAVQGPANATSQQDTTPDEAAPQTGKPQKSFEQLLFEEGRSATTRRSRGVTLAAGGLLAAVTQENPRSFIPVDAGPKYGSATPGKKSIPNLTRVAAVALAADQPVGERHQRPLEFGLTAGIPLGGRWTAVTGLEYALYLSKFSYSASGTISQQAHYLGIPLRLNFNLLDYDRFRLYLGAGVKGDIGILARRGTERLTPDGFGFSLQGAGGVQWDATRRFGLYLEPRYEWFLSDTQGRMTTYRTQSPSLFSLSAGLRFHL